MGQFALGIRSLLIKGAVFFVMAALLAWALGGTLWPRTQRVGLGPVEFAGGQYHLQLVAPAEAGCTQWQLMLVGAAAPIAAGLADECVVSVDGPAVRSDVLELDLLCASGQRIQLRVNSSGAATTARLPR